MADADQASQKKRVRLAPQLVESDSSSSSRHAREADAAALVSRLMASGALGSALSAARRPGGSSVARAQSKAGGEDSGDGEGGDVDGSGDDEEDDEEEGSVEGGAAGEGELLEVSSNEAVVFKLLGRQGQVLHEFRPGFTHQIFEDEIIRGYEELTISVYMTLQLDCYVDATYKGE
jgi:hypothetical protein